MTVAYLFRKPVPGAHSIEQIFQVLAAYTDEHLPMGTGQTHFAPALSSTLWGIWANIQFARRCQGEVNHVTGDIHYVLLGLSRQSRNVLTIHDCGFMHRFPKWSLKRCIFQWLWLRWPVRQADVVTVISEKTRADVLRFTGCPAEKVVIVPNFVHPIFEQKRLIFNEKTPRILHLGTSENKNLERLIPALEGLPCVLDIVGQLSNAQKNLLKKHSLYWENSQNLTMPEVAEKYRQCDMVVFASTFEGFGMPIIEAQKTGRPVLTSNLSPMREVSGGAACLVDPMSEQSIREGVEKIIREAAYRDDLIARGLENVKKYDLETVAQQYFDLYRQPCVA